MLWRTRCTREALFALQRGHCGMHVRQFIAVVVTVIFFRYEKPAGLLITAYVYIVYLIALRFEG